MTGHLYVPALDKSHKPASFSKAVVTDLLQKELGFQGLCFTDALAMKGASTKKTDNPSVKALLAGNDILLAPAAPINDFTAVKEAIEEGVLDLEAIEAKCLKILRYKYIAGLNAYKPVETKGLSKRLNSPHAAWMAAKLNSEAITVLKNEDTILPLKQLNKKKIAALSIGDGVGNEFQKMLGEYDSIACFSIGRRSTAAQVQQVYNKLQKYDVIICGVHTIRIPESLALRQLPRRKSWSMLSLPCHMLVRNIRSRSRRRRRSCWLTRALPYHQIRTLFANLSICRTGGKGRGCDCEGRQHRKFHRAAPAPGGIG